MDHAFIINPVAGKGYAVKKFLPALIDHFKGKEDGFSYYITKEPGDATRIASELASKGEPVRIYACGGDGTLLETANGLVGHDNAELGVIPCGSGNDFLKSFGAKEDFLDLDLLDGAKPVKIDMIGYGKGNAVNICSMGMDAMVAEQMLKYKKWPLISGPMAYQLAVITTFLGKIGVKLDITIDDDKTFSGDYLFALAANGKYYGGGYEGSPLSDPTDGKLDFILIRKIPRLRIFSLLNRYKRGEHLDLDICTYVRGSRMEVRSNGITAVNMDGECIYAEKIVFEALPGAIKFLVPDRSGKETVE